MIGTGIFLLFAHITYINRLGYMLLLETLISLTISFILFPAVLHLIGPNENFGNFLVFCKCMH